jgi:hypothetical protein
MLSTFENMLRFAANDKASVKEEKPNRARHTQKAVTKQDAHNGKYGSEIKELEGVYGELNNKTITVELQDLLALIPRERKRIDAYRGLVSTLKKDLGCTLNITSRKTK